MIEIRKTIHFVAVLVALSAIGCAHAPVRTLGKEFYEGNGIVKNYAIVSTEQHAGIEKAESAWAAIAGREILGTARSDHQISVNFVLQSEMEDPAWTGQARFPVDQRHCVVKIKKLASGEYAWALFAHELGHCIGFGHSTDTVSIMNHKYSNAQFTPDLIELFRENDRK